MSAVVLGYVPNALGDAAAKVAVDEARQRGATLVVVNTTSVASPVQDKNPSRATLDP